MDNFSTNNFKLMSETMPEVHNAISGNIISAATIATTYLFHAESVHAVNGNYGILEGKWIGMIHPISFLALFVVGIYTAVQGFKWRQSRIIQEAIKSLQQQDSLDGSNIAEIEKLKYERQQLLKNDPRSKHVSYGSLLLGSGAALALEGALTTYWRVGELFPDAHLFAGLGIVAIWSLSFSLAPLMVKGNPVARNLHIALNTLGLALFTSQILSGWEIMINVWNETPGW